MPVGEGGPAKAWKRPLLAVLSLPLAALGIAIVWFIQELGVVAWLSAVFITGLAVLDLLTSIIGCDSCVAKLFGKMDF